jgi:regulator of protease activity HflC (stomatin/prohibitin superfamily)
MDIAQALRALATLAWLAAIGVIVLAVVRATRGKGFHLAGWLVAGAFILAVLLTAVSAGLVFIQPEERGVVISAVQPNGYRDVALQPGLSWVIPFAETVVRYPISRQTYTMSIAPAEGQVEGDDSIAARTADGQEVFIDASVIYAIDPNKVVQVHIQWQNRYTNDLVRAQVRGIIRDVASRYGVQEIYGSKRGELTNDIAGLISDKLAENGLLMVDFVLRNITFSQEYAASVEQKQIAEQQAQQARFVVEQRRQEAEQARQVAQGQADAAVIAAEGRAKARLVEAEAEAKALEMIAAALEGNPDLISYQYVQKLAPGVQVMLVPNNAPYILPIPTLTPAATPTP